MGLEPTALCLGSKGSSARSRPPNGGCTPFAGHLLHGQVISWRAPLGFGLGVGAHDVVYADSTVLGSMVLPLARELPTRANASRLEAAVPEKAASLPRLLRFAPVEPLSRLP